jgi:hypothetical protein
MEEKSLEEFIANNKTEIDKIYNKLGISASGHEMACVYIATMKLIASSILQTNNSRPSKFESEFNSNINEVIEAVVESVPEFLSYFIYELLNEETGMVN